MKLEAIKTLIIAAYTFWTIREMLPPTERKRTGAPPPPPHRPSSIIPMWK